MKKDNAPRFIGRTGFGCSIAALAMAICLPIVSGCSQVADGRTSLGGEFCINGFCIRPQAATVAPAPAVQPVAIGAPVVAGSAYVGPPVVAPQPPTVMPGGYSAPAVPLQYRPTPEK